VGAPPPGGHPPPKSLTNPCRVFPWLFSLHANFSFLFALCNSFFNGGLSSLGPSVFSFLFQALLFFGQSVIFFETSHPQPPTLDSHVNFLTFYIPTVSKMALKVGLVVVPPLPLVTRGLTPKCNLTVPKVVFCLPCVLVQAPAGVPHQPQLFGFFLVLSFPFA